MIDDFADHPRRLQEELTAAVEAGDQQRAEAAGLEMAGSDELDYPLFHRAIQMLGYHDWLSLLNQMMEVAWPHVKATASYRTPAIEAFAALATDHLIYEHLTTQMEPVARDRVLIERLEYYFPVDAERLVSYMSLLTGRLGRNWKPEEFAALETEKLNGLLVEFVGYAHRQEEIGYGRAHLAREQIPGYLLDRRAGNLYPRQPFGRRPAPPPPRPDHPLCPDPTTLQNYLEKMVQTVNPLPYGAAALHELAPAWLRFLEWRRLIPSEQAQKSRAELRELEEAVGRLLPTGKAG